MDAVKRVEVGFAVPDICRELGVSTATFYKWRAKYGGMAVSMMSRMKELEEENRCVKKMYLEEKLKAEIVAETICPRPPFIQTLISASWWGFFTSLTWAPKTPTRPAP